MKIKIAGDYLRAYILPATLLGLVLGTSAIIVKDATRINFPKWYYGSVRPTVYPLPEGRFEFLRGRQCGLVQYPLRAEQNTDVEFGSKAEQYYEMLGSSGYLPSVDAIKTLETLSGGEGYDLGMIDKQDRLILSYRTKDAPSPFQAGFTLVEPASNQGVKELLREGSATKPGIMNYYLMDGSGQVVYLAVVDSENCSVMTPPQMIFRAWLRHDPWEDLVFAQQQKRAARKLEEIARNPNRELLRPVSK